MLKKIVMPRAVAALQYIKAAEEAFVAARAREARAGINGLHSGTKIKLREEARALRKRGLELRNRGEGKMESLKKKWPI